VRNRPLILGFGFQAIEVLVQLQALRHLDLSDEKDDDPTFETGRIKIAQFLKRSGAWPNLVSLDISGVKKMIHCANHTMS
jgi:hypothetical protein